MLRFGIVSAYPRDDWHSQRLADACREHGAVNVFEPTEFAVSVDGGGTRVLVGGEDVAAWDVWLLARALGEFGDPDFHCALYLDIEELGAPVVNPVGALLAAQDKIRTSFLLARAGVPTPRAVAVQSVGEAMAALDVLGDAVAKPPYGSLGIGILRLSRRDRDARRMVGDLLQEHGLVYLQAWMPSARPGRDLRVFVVGGKVTGAVERIAAPGQVAANVSRGGVAEPAQPDDLAQQIAVAATRVMGLEYAGVDLVVSEEGATVIEVNGLPSWQGIHDVTGRDMAHDIAARAVELAGTKGETRWTNETWKSATKQKRARSKQPSPKRSARKRRAS